MKSITDGYQLNNGIEIPCVGFGTWQMEGDTAIKAVKDAIAAGYRHIDTAFAYGNEESIGIAVRESGIAREELFITSKLKNPDHGYEETVKAFEITMKNLNMDYLDMYLIHWPNPKMYRDCWAEKNAGSWKAFEEFYKAGRIRAIGISNFRPHHIEELLKTAEILPAVNQIKLCPGETQPETVAYCKKHNILLQANSPLGTGAMLEVPEMKAFAEKYNKSIAQVCIRWSLQMGFLPLPKSTNPGRMLENADVFDFEIESKDMETIANLKGYCGELLDPDTAFF